MKPTNLIITLLFLSCNHPSPTQKPQEMAPKTVVSEPKIAKSERFKIIHVYVALCDNAHQGIVKVPPKIGNGQDAENNLYWGCDLGTKTFIKKHKDWTLVQTVPNPRDKVLERCIFKHKTKDVLMVADAYDGAFIKLCTTDFFKSCSGNFNNVFNFGNDTLACGGQSDLFGYIGHNGLMEFEIEEKFSPKKPHKRDAIILGCFSKFDFSPHLKQTGAEPLVWTMGLMAPEAYTLVAAIEGWILGKSKEETSEMAAQAYHLYQKCGIIGARKLLVTGW